MACNLQKEVLSKLAKTCTKLLKLNKEYAAVYMPIYKQCDYIEIFQQPIFDDLLICRYLTN